MLCLNPNTLLPRQLLYFTTAVAFNLFPYHHEEMHLHYVSLYTYIIKTEHIHEIKVSKIISLNM